MPFCSDISYSKLYVEPADLNKKLQDVVRVLESLLALDVSLPMKKIMLNHSLWLVTEASGVKASFKSRYRSAEVIKGAGEKIQRDHHPSRETIVKRLLQGTDKVEDIVHSICICVVTEAEHKKLHDYDTIHPEVIGWARYQNSGVIVYDMLTGTKIEPQ